MLTHFNPKHWFLCNMGMYFSSMSSIRPLAPRFWSRIRDLPKYLLAKAIFEQPRGPVTSLLAHGGGGGGGDGGGGYGSEGGTAEAITLFTWG